MLEPNLRPYQTTSIQELRQGVAKKIKRQVLMSPTGSGKTEIAMAVIYGAVLKGKRVVFLCNRINLVNQASRRFYKAGISHGIIQGSNTRQTDKQVIIASIQTVAKRAMPECSLIVIDEVHGASGSAEFRKVIFDNKDKTIIGLTATPWSKGMSKPYPELDDEPLFQRMVVATTIGELITQGFLVDCDIYAPEEPDMSGFKMKKNSFGEMDYSDMDVGTAVDKPKLIGGIVEHWLKLAKDTPTVCFASNISHSKHIVEEFRSVGVPAEHIDCYTDEFERAAILKRVETGDTMVISNVGILCLDEKTEILTSEGWVGIDEMSSSHEVANWDEGKVFFETPKEIFRRDRGHDEPMFSISGTRSARVTSGHNIIYRSGAKANLGWSKRKVDTLESAAFTFPVSGMADAFKSTEVTQVTADINRLVIKRSHHLRKHHGYTYEDSVKEAFDRVERKYSLKKLSADQLTEDHCRFIGLFHADGTATKLKTGGVEFVFCQASNQPLMVKKFDDVFNVLGYHNIKKEKEGHFRWNLCRGTGSGVQERSGVFEIEHFLRKKDLGFLWELSEAQFDAFIHGFWLGDGNHGFSGELPPGHGMRLYQEDKSIVDVIQAVASVRGYRTNARHKKNGYFFIYTLSVKKQLTHSIASRHSFVKEAEYKKERVWCVKVSSGSIITRHNGCVMVMGNCEGWDFPACKTMILARPTRSLIRYIQMIGRVLRPHHSKERALVLDHSGTVSRLGFPTDDFPMELDDGKARDNKAQEKKELLPTVCQQCKFVKPRRSPVCPRCGAVNHTPTIEVEPGELKKLEKKEKVTMEDKQAWWSSFLSLATEKKKNRSWALAQYKQKFGVWPKGLEEVSTEPVVGVRSWVISRAIAWANSQEKAVTPK